MICHPKYVDCVLPMHGGNTINSIRVNLIVFIFRLYESLTWCKLSIKKNRKCYNSRENIWLHLLGSFTRDISSGVSKVTAKNNEKWFNEFRYDMYKHSLIAK